MQGRDVAGFIVARSSPTRIRRVGHVLALLLALAQPGCTRQPEVVIHAAAQPVRVKVELAITPEEQRRGLMYRQHLAPDSGMLFVFPETAIQSFWMKNTPLPLDMIFIDEDREIVGIVENTVPFSTTSRMVPRPSRYVLEVNGGFSKQHGIDTGQRVDLPALPPAK